MRVFQILGLALTVCLASFGMTTVAQSENDEDVATLYRNSGVNGGDMRLLIATFNSEDNAYGSSRFDYNLLNCSKAAEAFNSNPFSLGQYWCEQGFYKE